MKNETVTVPVNAVIILKREKREKRKENFKWKAYTVTITMILSESRMIS